jgi:hypothetical protein
MTPMVVLLVVVTLPAHIVAPRKDAVRIGMAGLFPLHRKRTLQRDEARPGGDDPATPDEGRLADLPHRSCRSPARSGC